MITPRIVTNFIEHPNTAQTDPAGGIRIVNVMGDEHVGIDMADMKPQSSVTAHYHKSGNEIYRIIHGGGRIHSCLPSANDTLNRNRSVDLKSGDYFTINEGLVHQLENTGSAPMIACFVCPAAHIGHDR